MSHATHERTLVIIKPDGIQRSLIGEITKRFERIGLKLVAIKMMAPTGEHIESHYTLNPDWRRSAGQNTIDKYIQNGQTPPISDPFEVTRLLLVRLKKYMTAGPVIVMVWQGAHAVEIVRKLVGVTEPKSSDVGTIRGDFMLDSYTMSDTDDRSIRNLVHASGSVSEAQMEIKHWFADGEILEYRLVQEQILYDVNLDGTHE